MQKKNLLKNTQTIQIVMVPIEELHSAEYNPRKWSESQLKQVMESIRVHGFVNPLVVNGAISRRGVVIAGHLRLDGARELKIKEVPVVLVDIPDIEQEKALNLRLNRGGTWDDLKLADIGIDLLEIVGFDSEELCRIFDSNAETEDDHFDVDQEIKKITEPTVKVGEMRSIFLFLSAHF